MARHLSWAFLSAGTAMVAATAAQAGGSGGCCQTKPPPPPPPSVCCNVPTTHNVNVPGVMVTPPSVSVYAPSIAVSGASAYASASASASASGYASGQAQGSAFVYAVGGGGSSFFVDQGSTGLIPNLTVEGQSPLPGRPICAAYKTVAQAVAIQAVCLDDKAVPHPASQAFPGQDVAEGFAGELFRCLAGTRMQYTTAAFQGRISFDHGQTATCAKGEALNRMGDGRLQCRPQTPARDCNERSLLRRYGAGVKLVKASAAQVCVDYRSETQTAQSTGGSFLMDGGVGGVAH